MIVRDSTASWLLIPQVEHARIAAEIAAAWQRPDVLAPLDPEFQHAVAHHDDGWQAWEQLPTIDDDGRPRDFMDMPMPVATEIWSASIDSVRQHSLWGGLWTSRHFCHLAQLAVAHRQAASDLSAARRFLAMQSVAQSHWRASLGVAADSPTEPLGLHGLQCFDRLSLWLCCAERSQPQEFDDPAGGTTRWMPESPSTICVVGRLTVPELQLSAPTVAIPQRRYSSDADLHAAMASGQRTTLNWTLIRA